MNKKAFVFQWLLALACMLVAVHATRAQDYPEIMFVLDSSGSMQAPLQGRAKLDIAKEVLRGVVPGLPPEVRLGLAAYGHRNPRDCEDVEIIVPPGSNDRAALLAQVDALVPVGMTPITLALAKVAELLQTRQGETTVVLLTDGLETCGGDPLALMRKLKQTDLRLVLYVVGYDIKDKEKQALLDLAQAGDGRYFPANDAASLLAALETVRKDIEKKVAKAKTEKVQKKTGLGKLHLTLPAAAVKSLAGIQIRRRGEEKVVKKAKLSAADSMHPLMSGEYELWLDFANPNYKPPTSIKLGGFNVNGGATTELALGAIAFNLADGLADHNISFLQIIARATGEVLIKTEVLGNDYYLFKPKPVPDGIYDLAIGYYRSPAPMLLATNITVAAGKQATVTLDAGFVLKKPASTSVTGWDLLRSGSQERFLQVRRGHDNQEPLWRRFIVPPGRYNLLVYVKGMDEPLPAGSDIEVRKGQTIEFDAGL